MSDLATFVGDRYYRSQFQNGLSSYLVFQQDGVTYADPLFPGGTPYSGNAATAGQSTIDAMSAGAGGELALAAGTFNFGVGESLTLKSGVYLRGMGRYTPFYGGAARGTILKRTAGSGPIIKTDDAGITNAGLANLTIDQGFATASHGLLVQNAQESIFEKLSVINVDRTGVGIGMKLAPLVVAAPLNNINGCLFRSIHIDSAYYGIEASGPDSSHVVTNNRFDHIYMVNISNIGLRAVNRYDSNSHGHIYGSILTGGKGMVLNDGTPASDVGVNNDQFTYLVWDMASGSDQAVTVNKNSEAHYIGCRLSSGLSPRVLVQNDGLAIIRNQGMNSIASAITVGASVFTYTNNDDFPEIVAVSGGTVSNVIIGRDGITDTIASATNLSIYLEPQDAISVTYSVAPTMRKYPAATKR